MNRQVMLATPQLLSGPAAAQAGAIGGAETLVLRSGRDRWKIVHIHRSSRIRNPGEPH